MENKQQCTQNLQERDKIEKCSIPYSYSGDNPMVNENNNSKINYFLTGLQQEVGKKGSAELTEHFHRELKDEFTEIGSFNVTFLMQIEVDSNLYEAEVHILHITKTIQGRPRMATASGYQHTTRCE